MSNVKLTYFNGRGLGETIRMLLRYNNTDFEDIRLRLEQWPAVKSSTPFGQLPLYEEDGKLICQSTAVARYLARKVKLAGDTEWESLEIDVIVDTITDFRIKVVSYYWEPDQETKEKAREILLKETIPFYLDKFEKIVKQNNGYLAVKRCTWADIYFLNIVALYEARLNQTILDNHPELRALIAKVSEVPAIKAWIEIRPPSHF